jgi:diadenosine tetraphosphate (Ap4A) HIT family hydrolase
MNDARFPWLILVPQPPQAKEWHELDLPDAVQLAKDIRVAAQALQQYALPDKINIASLGNVVRQLHIHVIARKTDDVAWPRTVWESGEGMPYSDSEARSITKEIVGRLKRLGSTAE